MRKGFLILAVLTICTLWWGTAVFAQEWERKEVNVPKVDPSEITLDGVMDEAAWDDAGHADLITPTGFEIWTNKYYREALTEPDYDEMYGRMLWSDDTLFVFMHIDEFVNDSTNLFWAGKWTGDQLFISLSNRLAVEMMGWYDGNVYAAPDGPYHYWILGEDVTLNGGDETYIPEEYRDTNTSGAMAPPMRIWMSCMQGCIR